MASSPWTICDRRTHVLVFVTSRGHTARHLRSSVKRQGRQTKMAGTEKLTTLLTLPGPQQLQKKYEDEHYEDEIY